MSTELALIEIEITPETAPAIFKGNGLDHFYKMIEEAANEVPDVSTAKGRARIASRAAKVSSSKVVVTTPGREHLKTIKELPRLLERELKEFEDKCNALRIETRRPLTEWEAEQAAIEEKRIADALAEKLHAAAIEHEAWFDSIIAQDWELALLADQIFNRDAADKRQAAEQAQRERDAALVQEAAARAKADAEAKAQADKDASDKREREALLAKERAEADLARAAQHLKDAEAKTAQDKIDAEKREAEAKEKAAQELKEAQDFAKFKEEQAKAKAAQDLIEEKRRAELAAQVAEENRLAELAASARREQEAAQREIDRQAAEVKRLADEQAARDADTAHRAKINRAAVAALIETGVTEDQAKAVLLAIYKKRVPNVSITY